jgi:2-polyprenyl-6-methoxyphenol hydroxylase-like FAD-dependent oxidoreductase
MPHYHVGITGFGIAGGTLAILLARAGHKVTLIERAPQVGPVGAGFLLQPSGQRVLKRIGLLENIAAQSEPLHGLHAFKASGGTLVHLRYKGAGPNLHAYGVHRGLLFETLHQAVLRENVDIELNSPIQSFRESDSHIFAVTETGTELGPFDLLVAADGARSALRRALNPTLTVHEYDYGAIWSVGRNTRVHGYLHQITDGTHRLLGLLPIGNDRCTMFWGLKRDQMETVKAAGFNRWRDEVLALSPLAEETINDVATFDNVVFAGYQHTSPGQLYGQRIVLIGDAAHAMSPHLGQGANLALLDAESLAQALAMEASLPVAFQRYVRNRNSQNQYYSLLSLIFTPFFQSNGQLLGMGRDIALPLMQAIPPMRWQMELSLAGLKTSLFGHNLKAAA